MLCSPNFSSDPAQEAFDKLSNFMRHDWVKSFLLPSDSSCHLEQLQYAIAQQSTALGILNLSTFPSHVGQQHTHAVNEELLMLFAPSYTALSLTAGFQVIERRKTASPLYERNPRYVTRTIRDDDNGVFLAIAQFSEMGLTELHLTIQVSPGYRNKTNLLLDANAFRAACCRNGTLDRALFRQALLHCLCSVELRPCPTCKSDTVMACFCGLPLARKLHPLDHKTEIRNLATYGGRFQGFGALQIFEEGREAHSGYINFLSETMGYLHHEDKKVLSVWAMQDAARARTINMLRLTMPEASAAFGVTSSETDDVPQDATMAFLESVPYQAYLQKLLAHSCTDSELLNEREKEGLEPSDTNMHSRVIVSSNPSSTNERAAQLQWRHKGGTAFLTMRRRRTGDLPLLPAPTPQRLINQNKLPQDIRVNHARRKAELRLLRNRTCAQRSNERKRLYLQSLKDNIARASKREVELRGIERILKRENVMLKQAVAER